jgi:signal transduction histidine kinase
MPLNAQRRHSLEGKLELLVDASATLLGSLRVDDILPAVLALAKKLNAPQSCAVWRFVPQDSVWRIAAGLSLSDTFLKTGVPDPPGPGMGAPPYGFEDVNRRPFSPRERALYKAEGIRSLISLPMTIRGRFSGALAFYYKKRRRFSKTEMRTASALANLAAAAIETAELYREQEQTRAASERDRHRSAFLAEASAVLASSLDYETTLATVARSAVPHIADWCAVHVVQADGSLKQLALAHACPAKPEAEGELNRQFPSGRQAAVGPVAVIRTGKSALAADVRGAGLPDGAQNDEHFQLMRDLGFTSYMCVPMAVRERVLGSITFLSAQPGRRFDLFDLALAEDLARRAAMAIDNALLYARVQRERTALEAALHALRENEERLLMALDAGSMGIWDWDIAAGSLHWSGNLSAVLGFTPRSGAGGYEALLSMIDPADRGSFQSALDRAIQNRTYFETEFRIQPQDEAARWIGCKGRAIYGETGRAVRVLALAMDITQRRGLEEKLRKAQKLESIGMLAGGIAHDFNNLLTGMMGNASLALNLQPEGSPATPLIANIMRGAERAAELTQQLLAYSGKGRFIVQPVSLSDLVGGMEDLAHATLAKEVKLQLDLAPGLPCVEGDPNQLQQVVMNLISNAAEAIGDRPGTITVSTGLQVADEEYLRQFSSEELRPGQYVFLEVRDTGCGMTGETLSKIFDPFFTTKFTGRGLGLAAVSGIVRSHHGAIQVVTEPGEGSLFRVLLPAASYAEKQPAPVEPVELRGSGLVLVVDEEELVRSAARNVLQRYGYRVETARNPTEGVALFGRRPADFAAVLFNLTNPASAAERAVREIKRIRPDIPVVASSGSSELEARRYFSPGELAGFLQKPYTSAGLAQKLRAALPNPLVQKQTNI